MKKKNILVTGAGKGIGLATTKKLLEDGKNYLNSQICYSVKLISASLLVMFQEII